MKKKAFTLIELLAVIIILGVIALIVYPIIMGTIERSKKASFARSIDGLIESTRIDYSEDKFIAPREYFYEKRDLTLLTVNEKTRDEDVKISGKIDGSGFIYIDDDGNISVDICTDDYYAKGPEDDVVITDNPDGTCKTVGKEDPVISLIGDSIIYLNLGEEYKELGAKARTKVGGKLEYTTEIKKNNEVVGSIDTSREGTYEVVYSASNNDKTVSVTRTVVVLDMTPVITMTEPNTNYVKTQEVLINVTATKPNNITEFTYEVLKDGTSIKKETVSGLSKNLSFSETGIYEVIVSVTDNNEHSNRVTKIYRIDHTAPVITFDPEIVELESEDVSSYNLLTGVIVTDNVDGTIENSKVSTSGMLAKAPGSYTITYTVSDRLGNETTKIRTFVVKDLTKPEIVMSPNEQSTFAKSKTITITATDNIKVNSISYVLIKDNVRGNSTTINNGGTVTVNSTGNYQIEVTAIDSSNNRATKTSGVYKIDTTAPSIAFSNVQLKITEVNGYNLMTGVTTSDNSGVISRVDKSGALSATLGTQTITYTVYDQAGNSTSKTRTFTIVEADGPILALSNEGSNSWTKAQTITATATDNSNLKTFTYEVFKNNVSQGVKNGTINGKSGSVSIPLNADGTYTIKLTASDQYNNSSNKTSASAYKIDVTAPTAPTTMNFVYSNWSAYPNNTWANQDVYVARTQANPGPTGSTDGTSGVAKYQMSLDNKNWFDYAYTATGNYLLSTNGTHTRYFRAVDHAGNASSSISRVAKVDKTIPTISRTTPSITKDKGENYAVTNLYTGVIFGPMGGSTTCKVGTTTVTNLNSLTDGNYSLRCTALGNNGKSNYVDIEIKIVDNSLITVIDKPTSNCIIRIDNNGNKRCAGADPNNYVCFGPSGTTCDEKYLYRIIGSFDKKAKIIKETELSHSYHFNFSNSGYPNDWAHSTLNGKLNGTDFYDDTYYINSAYKSYIANGTWYTGSLGVRADHSDPEEGPLYYSLGDFEDAENRRSTTSYIGVINVSDYGYASGDSRCNRNTDLTKINHNCVNDNWLWNYGSLTMTPHGYFITYLWAISRDVVQMRNVDGNYGIRPVLYLNSSVKVTSGTGTKTDPYILTK